MNASATIPTKQMTLSDQRAMLVERSLCIVAVGQRYIDVPSSPVPGCCTRVRFDRVPVVMPSPSIGMFRTAGASCGGDTSALS